jgi:hypothetical protein
MRSLVVTCTTTTMASTPVSAQQQAQKPKDFAGRLVAIKTSDELIGLFKAEAAKLMPPTLKGEDKRARLWNRIALEGAISIAERDRHDIKTLPT